MVTGVCLLQKTPLGEKTASALSTCWWKNPGQVCFLLQLMQWDAWCRQSVLVSSVKRHLPLSSFYPSSVAESVNQGHHGLLFLPPSSTLLWQKPPAPRQAQLFIHEQQFTSAYAAKKLWATSHWRIRWGATLVSPLSDQLFPCSWVFRKPAKNN